MGMFTDLIDDSANKENQRFNLNYGYASKRGLTLLSMFLKKPCWYGNYIFNTCGHSAVRQISNIRNSKGVIACKVCSNSRANEAESSRGLKCLGASSDGHISKRRYKVLKCGHEVDIFYSNLQKPPLIPYVCDECTQSNILSDMLRCGVELVEKAPDSVKHLNRPNTYNKYRYLKCGHTFHKLENSIKHGVTKCSECEEIDYLNLVKQRGLELLGTAAQTNLPSRFKSYRFTDCGHIRDIDRVCVTRNNFICHECNDSYLNNASNIYLFKINYLDFTFLKLGYGKNPKNRIREYGLLDGSSSELLYSFPVVNGRVATKIELDIHSDFIGYKLPVEKMKQYMKRTGYTECYPLELESVLLSKMQEVYIKTKESNE